MLFKTRKMVFSKDLNPAGTLFGGTMLRWIDEEAAIYAACKLNTSNIVTAHMSEINFKSPGFLGDVVEIGVEVVSIGTTSITVKCVVRNKDTKQDIVVVDKIVFVNVVNGSPVPHGITKRTITPSS